MLVLSQFWVLWFTLGRGRAPGSETVHSRGPQDRGSSTADCKRTQPMELDSSDYADYATD